MDTVYRDKGGRELRRRKVDGPKVGTRGVTG